MRYKPGLNRARSLGTRACCIARRSFFSSRVLHRQSGVETARRCPTQSREDGISSAPFGAPSSCKRAQGTDRVGGRQPPDE